MSEEAERSSQRWKWISVASLLLAFTSIAALVAFLVHHDRVALAIDERLLGTWQSDADRTLAEVRERTTVTDTEETAFRELYGKLRVTYTPTSYTTDLNGTSETHRYEVLGKDKCSVVIREIEGKPSPLDEWFELSEFILIQFDGPDSYWVHAKVGGDKEYFKRVR